MSGIHAFCAFQITANHIETIGERRAIGVQSNAQLIAADYAFTFLNQFANVAISALTKQHRLNDEQRKLARQQREDVQKFMSLLQQEQATLYRKVTAVSTVATDMERLERNLRSSMSLHALDMLGYSSRSTK